MSLRLSLFVIAAAFGAQLAAQPAPSITAVVNGASFHPGIASGGWISVFGTNLSPTTRLWRADEIIDGVLPTELDGVRVTCDGKLAAVSFISPGQLNVQVPDGTALGPVAVVVERNGVVSGAVIAQLQDSSPAFFHFDPEQRRYLAALHPDGVSVGKPDLFSGPVQTRTAKPGDILLLFGTGFGPTLPAVEAGKLFSGAAPLASPAKVFFNGIEASVQFGGLSAAGLNQFNVVVPQNLPPGDAEVVALVAGLQTEPGVFVTVGERDTTRPTATVNVNGASDIPRNAAARILFSEAMDPTTINADTIHWRIEDSDETTPLPGVVSLDPTRTIVELSPVDLLPAQKHLVIQIEPEVTDASGNLFLQTSYPFASFWTGSSSGGGQAPAMKWPDWLSTVTVPTNFPWWELAREVSSVALDPESFAGDLVVLRDANGKPVPRKSIPHPYDLEPSSEYTLSVQAARDFEGNLVEPPPPMALRTSNGTDTTRPQALSSEPAAGSRVLPVDSQFKMQFSERLWVTSILLYSPFQGAEIVEVPFMQSADGRLITAVPAKQMYPNTQYSLTLVGQDLGGNRFDPCCYPWPNYYFFEFSTDGPLTPDSERPRLISSSPLDGAMDVTTREVRLTFSERLQQATARNGIAMYVDGRRYQALFWMNSDGATVNLRHEGSLPNRAQIDVVVSETVTDLAGNPAVPVVIRYSFLNPDPRIDPPNLHTTRPPGGAADVSKTADIYAFFTKPLDPSSAAQAFSVFENGVLVSGHTTVESNNQVLRFTPATPYLAGAQIRFVIQFAVLRDEFGLPIGNSPYESIFTVAGGVLPAVVQSWASPTERSPRNAQILVEFDRPMNPLTFAPNTISFSPSLAFSYQLEKGNQRLRIIPSGLLPANAALRLLLSGSIRAADGALLAYTPHLIETTDEIYDAEPSLLAASPADGSKGVGVNGTIDLVFSPRMQHSAIDESTVRWTDGRGQGVPCSIEISDQDGRTFVHITPHDPYRPSTAYTVTVAGIEDLAGHKVPTTTRTFTSGSAPDLEFPIVTAGPGGFGAPLNSAPSIGFNEPLSVATVSGKTVLLQRDPTSANGSIIPAEISLSPDGRTIFLKPTQLLEPHTHYGLTVTSSVRDLSGNASLPQGFEFNTGTTVDLTPLGLFFAAPASGETGVPINQSVVLVFDSLLQPGSVAENVRIEKEGQAIAVDRLVGGETIELKPEQVLEPSTAYRWVAEDLRDLAGNPMAAPLSGTFTTGPSVDLSPLNVESLTPANGATNVSRNVVIAYRYSDLFNPRTVYVDPDGIRDLSTNNSIPYSISYSPDLKTLYVTPTAPLPANSSIQVRHTVGVAADLRGSSGAQPDALIFTTGN